MICIVLAIAGACRDAPLPGAEAPTFVTPKRASWMQSNEVQMRPGEDFTWSVSVRGMRVGTAELIVRGENNALSAESRFQTIGIADQLSPVRYRLVTPLDGPSSDAGLPRVLGRVRAWAHADANPASLQIRFDNRSYLLKLAQPLVDHSLPATSLRIEAEARSSAGLIQMTLWLSADADRLPLQMTLTSEGKQVMARLVDVSES